MNTAHVAFVCARLAAAGVFILTWAYGVTTLSPFAFDMFVKPRLFPWLETFVNWHHVWYFAAVLLSAATLLPILSRGWRGQTFCVRAAWWASASYVVVFCVLGAQLISTPRLAMLTSGVRDLFVVPGALLPLLWLAVIDHLVGWPKASNRSPVPVTGQRRLLATCLGTAAFVWLVSIVRGVMLSEMDSSPLVSAMTHAWALAIGATAFIGVYLLLSLISAVAATARNAIAAEYSFAVLLLGTAVIELFRRVVFPPLMLSAGDAALAAVPLGAVTALMFSGLRLQTAGELRHSDTALDVLLGFRGSAGVRVLLLAVPAAATVATALIHQIDWAMILHHLIVVVESLLVFGLLLGWTRKLDGDHWSIRRLVIPPVAALLTLHAIPFVARAAVNTTGEGRLDPRQLLDRYQVTDTLTSLAARALVEQAQSDPTFFKHLLEAEARLSNLVPVPPRGEFADLSESGETARPHVFVFVIDSLRRDYLSPYNEAVTFTPFIDSWARDQFVFRNAFTPYGGTWLAMPSIWTGSAVTRRWGTVFTELNALETLIIAAGYDFVINDYTVADGLRQDTRRTFLDPSIPSVDTDLCRNITSLQAHFKSRSSDEPLFAYFAPMNVHIMNTRTGSVNTKEAYDGFYAPYASRLERLDGCFSRFIGFLKDSGIYDDSVIILTSDHGDSLGDDGRWGHQFYLFPEDIRLPLIVQLPSVMRSRLTADLGRVAFLTDLTPTLYQLLGYRVRDPGQNFGAPLFVDAAGAPVPRRRESFVVMSSYGSTYGLLRRNGRFLYVIDLVNRREDGFVLYQEPLGERVPVGDAARRLDQAKLLEGLSKVQRLYTP